MAYSKILFLSYAVPTLYPTPPGVVAAASGAPSITLSDPDLQARTQRLLNVVFWAQQQFTAQTGMTDSATLKLFMAPEFYFRRAPAGGAAYDATNTFGSYPEESRYELVEALSKALAGPAFQDWTLVAGTLCSALPAEAGGIADLLNTALLVRGNRSVQDGAMPWRMVEKHYISNIDGPPDYWHINLNPTSVFHLRQNPDRALDNLTRWDGMTVATEVCLDHSKGVASEALACLRGVLGAATPAFDLQIITSCGMDIQAPHVALKDGALALLTDGYSSNLNGYATPRARQTRYVCQGGSYTILDAQLPSLTTLPATADYTVTYPNYAGQQGVYAFDVQALLQN